VAPQDLADTALARRLVETVETQSPFLGFPALRTEPSTLTLTLAVGLPPHLDAAAYPEQRTIAVAFPAVTHWCVSKLRHVLRHELVHVLMLDVLGDVRPPPWFREGFAEWVATGLTCSSQRRISLDLLLTPRAEDLKTLAALSEEAHSRISYDYFVSFIAYLYTIAPTSTASGLLLSTIAAEGFDPGIVTVFGRSLPALEREWRNWLWRTHRRLPPDTPCKPVS